MAPIGKVYSRSINPKATRILAAARYNGLEVELIETVPGEDTQKPEFKAKFPYGKTCVLTMLISSPAFLGEDGYKLVEGRAIARYVAGLSSNSNLLGSDPKSIAEVEQWISYADDEIWNKTLLLAQITSGRAPYSKPLETKLWDDLKRALLHLDIHIKKHTYLVGHRVTLADLTITANLRFLFTRVAGPDFRNQYPNVTRYFQTVINQDKIADVFAAPDAELAKEDVKFVPPKKEAAKPVAAAAAAKPAEPKAAKKPAKEEDDDEPAAPAEPKAAHPCASLPPSKFVLDECKRQYSNLDTKPDFLNWFYANFDAEGYSLWRVDFKYNDELTQVFMSANQIGGFFTRLEASRKYVMGSAAVYGESNNSAIAGVFVIRGKNVDDVLGVAPDWESYTASPIDLKDAKQKQFFEDCLAWEGQLEDGKKLNDSAAKFMK